jgi:hypothetical protein
MKSAKYPFYLTPVFLFCYLTSLSQSPELALREFASGQIKKGVRSIGMGGDGATWGNYALVWKDSSTALFDAGKTAYTNGNKFSFTAVGITTPSLWHGLTVYIIALSQNANNILSTLKSPAFGNSATQTIGHGNNQAVFIKSAMPVTQRLSVGILLSYEKSQFNALSVADHSKSVQYYTNWLPSGGFGLSYQVTDRILLGFRGLFNNDEEIRTDNVSSEKGKASSQEYRLGVSAGLWKGALLDAGANWRNTQNAIRNVSTSAVEPNIGFEQALWQRHFSFRFGLDETSETAGITIRFMPLMADIAYVHNLGINRTGDLFGTTSNSIIITLIFNFENYLNKKR